MTTAANQATRTVQQPDLGLADAYVARLRAEWQAMSRAEREPIIKRAVTTTDVIERGSFESYAVVWEAEDKAYAHICKEDQFVQAWRDGGRPAVDALEPGEDGTDRLYYYLGGSYRNDNSWADDLDTLLANYDAVRTPGRETPATTVLSDSNYRSVPTVGTFIQRGRVLGYRIFVEVDNDEVGVTKRYLGSSPPGEPRPWVEESEAEVFRTKSELWGAQNAAELDHKRITQSEPVYAPVQDLGVTL